MVKANWWMILKALKKYKNLILIFLAYILVCFLTPESSYQGDYEEWRNWILYIDEHGLGNAYKSNFTNYPPVYLYILSFFNLFFDIEYMIVLKYIMLVFDFLPLVLLSILYKDKFKPILILWLMLNIGYLHNSMIWCQLDSIVSFFVVASLLTIDKNPYLSSVFYTFSILTKFQAIIFLPVFILFLINRYNLNFKLFFRMMLLMTLIVVIVFIPFIINGSMSAYYLMMSSQIGLLPSCSLNAYNLWFLILKEHPYNVSDNTLFLNISYKNWGMLVFFSISGFLLLKLLLYILLKRVKLNIEMAMLLIGFITLLFFFVNTEMHERYSHFAMLPFFVYGFLRKNYLLFLLISTLYFLNVEFVLHYFIPQIENYLFYNKLIAVGFLLLIVYVIYVIRIETKNLLKLKTN